MIKKYNRSDLYLLVFTVLITLFISLWLIRWIAPTLLGIPADLVLVKSSEEVVPYYENIFNNETLTSEKLTLDDPVVRLRGKPLFPHMAAAGPNDILGFRNISVPNDAGIIIIGDSQTYGNNVTIWENWPHQLKQHIPENVIIYSMATAGWGAIQYFYAFTNALIFNPEIAIIAFYTGNDPAETYSFVQASDMWNMFIPADTNMNEYQLPKTKFPAPPEEQWKVEFPDGITTIFTPQLRLMSNAREKAVDIAYEIMFEVALKINEFSRKHSVRVFYTIIPSKEYVYVRKITESGIKMNESYLKLMESESYRINAFSKKLKAINNESYINVAERLQQEALKPIQLYPTNLNGHPITSGYKIIADEIGKVISNYIDNKLHNGFYISRTIDNIDTPIFIKDGKFRIIEGDESRILEKMEEEGVTVISGSGLNALIYDGFVHINSLLD